MSTLKERIDELRGSKSLADFAKAVGVNRTTLYTAFKRETETGHHNIDGETARLIAQASKRSVAWVIGEAPQLVLVQPKESEGKVMPALAHELDPTTQDAMRWRALAELVGDGADVARAFQVLGTIDFDREVRAVSWGDFYAAAKRALRDGGRPAGGADLDR